MTNSTHLESGSRLTRLPSPKPATLRPSVIPPTTSETILVVDPYGQLCEMIKVILGIVGYRVISATNGNAALEVAREYEPIDLLLSELDPPGLGRHELIRSFARLHPFAAIVFTSSGSAPPGLVAHFGFLAKPFTMVELRQTVRRALRIRPALAETARAA